MNCAYCGKDRMDQEFPLSYYAQCIYCYNYYAWKERGLFLRIRIWLQCWLRRRLRVQELKTAKKKFKCKQCGKCCIVWFNNGCCVTLTDEEIESKKWLTGTMYALYAALTVLRKKTVYISRLGKKASCCIYLNVKTMKCKIQTDKLLVCRKYNCDGAQEFIKWSLLELEKPYRFIGVN